MYNPFVCDRKRAVLNNLDIDPDINYFNSVSADNNCTYFLPSELKNVLYTRNDTPHRSCDGTISIMHLNCRGLLGKYDEICALNDSLNNVFDIITMSETFMNHSNDEIVNIDGYSFLNKPREAKAGGGVGMYIKQSLEYKTRPDIHFDDTEFEICAIEVDNKGGKNSIIIAMYRPPNTNMLKFNSSVNMLCDKLKSENKFIYWTGDFNIDLLKTDSHASSNDFLQIMLSNSLYPVITKPTRITDYSATIIDNIFCNHQRVHFSGLIYTDISDHLPVFVMNNCDDVVEKQTVYFETRQMRRDNISNFNEMLSRQDWSDLMNITDTDEAYHVFIDTYTRIFDKCCPKIIRKTCVGTKKPWMSPALMKSRRTKEKLYKKYITSPTPQNKAIYNAYKNKFTQIKRVSEKNYYSNKLQLSKNNLKSTWKIIKEALNKRNSSSPVPCKLKSGNVILSSNEEISNKLNDFFTTIGPNLDEKIPRPNVNFTSFLKREVIDSLFLTPSTTAEIISIVKQFKNKSSFGWDEIPMTIIKETIGNIVNPLNHIFNLSISQGTVPS